MVDSVEIIRFFTEFMLRQKPRPFVEFTLSQRLRSFASLRMTGEGLRVTKRRVQNDRHPNFPIATQSQKGEESRLGEISRIFG
jgi:hypothetical protein